MPRKKETAAPVLPPQDEAPTPEVPDDITRGIMFEWGRVTLRTIDALKEHAPGWAYTLQVVYSLFDDVLGAQE